MSMECCECRFFTLLKIYDNVNQDYSMNINRNRNRDIEEILLKKGLPLEICEIIVKLSNKISLKKCSKCKKNLCNKHQEKAKNNAKCYNKPGLLCGDCSWYQYQV